MRDRVEKVDDDFSDIVKVKELGWMGWGGMGVVPATVCHIDGLPPLQNSQ